MTNYGPIARNIHGIDEAVDIDSLLRVTQTFVRYIIEQCQGVPLEGVVASIAGWCPELEIR